MTTHTRTTKHSHAMVFGRREPGCPRCAELDAGAPVIRQPWRASYARNKALSATYLQDHFTSEKHRSGGCGPVCTYGDW